MQLLEDALEDDRAEEHVPEEVGITYQMYLEPNHDGATTSKYRQ